MSGSSRPEIKNPPTKEYVLKLCEEHEYLKKYGWETNKGYGTRAHLKAIDDIGPIKEHRMTFAPLKTMVR